MSGTAICVDSSTLLTYAMQEQRWQAVGTILSGAANVAAPAPAPEDFQTPSVVTIVPSSTRQVLAAP